MPSSPPPDSQNVHAMPAAISSAASASSWSIAQVIAVRMLSGSRRASPNQASWSTPRNASTPRAQMARKCSAWRRTRRWPLAAGGQPLTSVQRQGLEQREPDLPEGRVGDDERLVDEAGQHVGDVRRLDVAPGADRLGRVERAAAGEHGQTIEHALLVLEEQVVAPLDHGAERLLARQRGADAAGQQPEPVVEPRGELSDGDGPGAGGGQLDREREAVEPGADLGDDRRHVGAPSRAPTDRGGSVDEQGGRVVGRTAAGTGQSASPGTPSALAARGQRPAGSGRPAAAPRPRGAASPITCSQLSRTSERVALADVLRHAARGLSRLAVRHGRGEHEGVGHGDRIAEGEPAPPSTRRLRSLCRRCHLHGEPGLAGPARTDDRHQSVVVDQRREGVQVGRPPDERAERRHQVRPPPRRHRAGRAGRRSRDGSWARIADSRAWSSGPGSRPSSSPRTSRRSWKARSASACRPAR